MPRWLPGLLVFAAMVVGVVIPPEQVSRMAAWLSDAGSEAAALGVAVLRPDDRSGDPNLTVLRPQSRGGSSFPLCAGHRLQNCVIDGDTIRHGGVKIRLADIDTPEVFSPKCPYEANLGRQATERLQELLNAGPIALERSGSRDTDRYGRKLRVVTRNGRSLGDILVSEGLARRWDGRRRSWCN